MDKSSQGKPYIKEEIDIDDHAEELFVTFVDEKEPGFNKNEKPDLGNLELPSTVRKPPLSKSHKVSTSNLNKQRSNYRTSH